MSSRASQRALLVHPGVSDSPLALPYAPWGALSLGTALSARGHEVVALDLVGLDARQSIRAAVDDFAPDVVGFTGKMGVAARRMGEMIDEVRSMRPETRIAVGGPLVSAFPDSDLSLWEDVDALFLGQAEASFTHWVDEGCVRSGIVEPEAFDLDAIGIPWHWDQLAAYVMPPRQAPGFSVPTLHVSGARGCTRRCGFCYLSTHLPGAGLNGVSAARLLRDMGEIARATGALGFCYTDDCLVDAGRTRINALSTGLRQLGSPYELGCSIQLSLLKDTALLRQMRDSGFSYLYVGVESANPAVRQRLGKDDAGDEAADVLQNAVDLGFFVQCSVGLGWPGETEAEAVSTLELVRTAPGVLFDAFRFLPLPGTPAFGQLVDSGLLQVRKTDLPFMDFGDNDLNLTSMDDSTLNHAWAELLRLRDERYLELSPSEITDHTTAGCAAQVEGPR